MLYNPRNDPRRESYEPPGNPKPWYRRFVDFVAEGHRLMVAFAGICAVTVVIHAWIRGIVRTPDLDAAVVAAVSKAMAETNTRVANLETRTAGVPEWRGQTTILDAVQDTKLQILEKQAGNFDQRLENMRPRR